ncbi:MAG: PhnD/SsuA/transferrin family substrate-binding protein [Magnetovibrio sp.]|nr:PhnD/SsuA/transferrin family substrate-binding protein [Magnetovibrio sp.]
MIGRRAGLAALLFAGALGFAAGAAAESYRIGVLAFRGAEHAVRSWAPTADYLSRNIDRAAFEIVPLPLAALRSAVEKREVAFVFTNSGQYVELETEFGISRIATLKTPFGSEIRNVFGAVVFTRADRTDIRTLADLRGKSLAAVKRRAFGGFQMAWREFKAAGIDPFEDLARLEFLGLPQDKIVFAVRDGSVDAGTVRTDVLETMAGEDAIRLADYRVLNVREVPGHDVRLSTRLYPEWPFATMPSTPPELAEKVAIALLSLKADSPAVLATGYAGWTVPLDYKPVHDMFRELEIGPYARAEIGIGEFLEQHWQWAVFTGVVVVLIGLHGIRTEYLVKRRTRQLSAANRELEHEIAERRRAEDRARRHEAELAHVSRVSVIGEMTSGLAHELRQPLTAISSYAEGGIRRLERGGGDLREALERIGEQALRAGQIISRVRGYMRKREPRREPVDINQAVEEAAALVRHDAETHGVELRLELADGLPAVPCDLIEIEQLVINLAKNAIDAMDAPGVPEKVLVIATGTSAGGVCVSVTDTGPGFGDNDPKAIWEPFYSRKPDGLGLGLAICRTIVENHGGRIWTDPARVDGAAVNFELPTMPDVSHAAE